MVLVEVRKTQTKMGLKAVSEFQEKVEIYRQILSIYLILPAFLSLGGFIEEAVQFCQTQGIATACRIEQF